MKFVKVSTLGQADDDALKIILFRCPRGIARGWFVGPVVWSGAQLIVPYEAKSKNLMAALAVIRALAISEAHDLPACIVDPDNLWSEVWGDAGRSVSSEAA